MLAMAEYQAPLMLNVPAPTVDLRRAHTLCSLRTPVGAGLLAMAAS
ncbi:hypothetical protein EMIT0P44_230065 [Pseudomonas sp. IT-P44]